MVQGDIKFTKMLSVELRTTGLKVCTRKATTIDKYPESVLHFARLCAKII